MDRAWECECGCGQSAPIAKITSTAKGWKKGAFAPTRETRVKGKGGQFADGGGRVPGRAVPVGVHVASGSQFANPYHDEEGLFAPKGAKAGAIDVAALDAEWDEVNGRAASDYEEWDALRKRVGYPASTTDPEVQSAFARMKATDAEVDAAFERRTKVLTEATDEELAALAESTTRSTFCADARREITARRVAANPPKPDRKVAPESVEDFDSIVDEAGVDRRDVMTSDWAGNGYRKIQGGLQSGHVSEWARPVVENLDSNMVGLSRDVVLYRGQSNGLDQLAAGQSFRVRGYTPTCTDPVKAMEFSKSAGAVLGPVRTDQSYPIMRVHVRAGQTLLPMESNRQELEVVIHRNAMFKVLGRTTMKLPDGSDVEVIDVQV